MSTRTSVTAPRFNYIFTTPLVSYPMPDGGRREKAEPFLSRFAPAHHNCRRGPLGASQFPSHISKTVPSIVKFGVLIGTLTHERPYKEFLLASEQHVDWWFTMRYNIAQGAWTTLAWHSSLLSAYGVLGATFRWQRLAK